MATNETTSSTISEEDAENLHETSQYPQSTPLADVGCHKRDILYVLKKHGESNGQNVKKALKESYESITNGRLYHYLDEVVEAGYVEKGQITGSRSNAYRLTEKGETVLKMHTRWAEGCFDE